MEALHAPWRIQYVRAPRVKTSEISIFTKIAQSNEDEKNYVVFRDKTCYVVLNTYPYAGGHVMVVPYRQVPTLVDLTDQELCDLMKLTQRCQKVLTQVLNPHGFNVGINLGRVAGAGIVEHLHIHVVPRWDGDTNFMPVIAETSVLPEALLEVAARIRDVFAQN